MSMRVGTAVHSAANPRPRCPPSLTRAGHHIIRSAEVEEAMRAVDRRLYSEEPQVQLANPTLVARANCRPYAGLGASEQLQRLRNGGTLMGHEKAATAQPCRECAA